MPSSRKHLTLDCVHLEYEIHKVTESLFIGSTFSANNEMELKKLGITHIINLGNQLKEYDNKFTVLWIPIKDDSETDLYSVIPITNLFISLALQKGKILVHCKKGRSRSPAIILAYLIHRCHYSFQESVDVFLRAKISFSLNTNFESQLVCYAESNGNEFAAEESFRLKHFNQVVRQFNEENESAEISEPLSFPHFEFITERGVVDITAICPFTHRYFCKKCKRLIITRNRFSVHGWDHSYDIDLCRSVMQAITEDPSVDEQANTSHSSTNEQTNTNHSSTDLSDVLDTDTRTLCQSIEHTIDWEKLDVGRRRRVEQAVKEYVALCKKWRDFRGVDQNCDCCVDCCSWIRKQLRTEPGVLVCPGEGCGAIVGSFSFSPFTYAIVKVCQADVRVVVL